MKKKVTAWCVSIETQTETAALSERQTAILLSAFHLPALKILQLKPIGYSSIYYKNTLLTAMAEGVSVPFVQEVFATRVAVNRIAPGTDVVIELGGEDAKILFLTNGLEVRMKKSKA